MMFGLSNLLIPAVLFFVLGFFARLVRSDLQFPPDLHKVLAIYLLTAIGIHGGYELGLAEMTTVLHAIFWAGVLGVGLPLIAYAVLVLSRKVDLSNAAAIAAHYGSVSVGTFMTARAYLDANAVTYEMHPMIMLAVMESPAIIVGLLLGTWSRHRAAPRPAETAGTPPDTRALLAHTLLNGSVVLLAGSMVIGAILPPHSVGALNPFLKDLFMGALCLFLLEMGMEAARGIGEGRGLSFALLAFGIVMPVIGAVIGVLVGFGALGFGIGGTTLVAVLAASASYIAVPPAMRLAIPEANPSLYLTLSLGITFPFNVMVGIPLYHRLAETVIGV
jgi:uncharacterized protein